MCSLSARSARPARWSRRSPRTRACTMTNFRTIRSRLSRMTELETLTEGEKAASFSKKQLSAYRRELRKIKRNLEGIRNMERLPGAIVLVDQKREINAVKEARKLG